MRILIVEDERPIAKYIERTCHTILGTKITSIQIQHNLESASIFLVEHLIDLCLLDLNLNGEDGYELLKLAVSGSFHTIIISANTDRAVEAFNYGVLDFIPKPFTEERLQAAFDRYFDLQEKREIKTKYLSVRRGNQIITLSIDDIIYFKASGIYVEAHLTNGKKEFLDKTMDRLGQILPSRFVRTHRSYSVDLNQIESYGHHGGGTYKLTLKSGETLPLSRHKYKELHDLLNY